MDVEPSVSTTITIVFGANRKRDDIEFKQRHGAKAQYMCIHAVGRISTVREAHEQKASSYEINT
jgi:hypothetical protein